MPLCSGTISRFDNAHRRGTNDHRRHHPARIRARINELLAAYDVTQRVSPRAAAERTWPIAAGLRNWLGVLSRGNGLASVSAFRHGMGPVEL